MFQTQHLLYESEPENHGSMITGLSEFDMKRSLDSLLRDAFEEISEGGGGKGYMGVPGFREFSNQMYPNVPPIAFLSLPQSL